MRVIFYLMKSLILFAKPHRHDLLPGKTKLAARSMRPARERKKFAWIKLYFSRQSSSETVPKSPITMSTVPANTQFSSVGPRRICTRNVPRNCPRP